MTSYGYNAAGELASVTDPVTTTSYTYDDAGRQLTTSQPDPNAGADLTTTTAYDADGNVLSVTDPKGNETDYTYDPLDKLSTVTQPAVSTGTPVTTYVYDNLGEPEHDRSAGSADDLSVQRLGPGSLGQPAQSQ